MPFTVPGSQTQLSKLAFGVADPVDTQVNFEEFDPAVQVEMDNVAGTTGQFDKPDEFQVERFIRVRPRFSAQPTALQLAYYLAWGMWGTPTGASPTTYPLGDTPAVRNIHWKPKLGEQFFMPQVACNRLTLRASVGGPLRCEMDLIGQTYDKTRSDFPAGLNFDRSTRPFMLNQLTLTAAGIVRNTRDFAFSVFHGIDEERYMNSLTLTDYIKEDQVVSLATEVPANATGLWDAARTSGISLVAAFVNGFGATLTITMGKFRPAVTTPTQPARTEGFQRWEGEAFQTGSARPVTVTLTPGP